MSETNDEDSLEAQLARSQEELLAKVREIEDTKLLVEQANAQAVEAWKRADDEAARAISLEEELKTREMRSELATLRILDNLRQQHQ